MNPSSTSKKISDLVTKHYKVQVETRLRKMEENTLAKESKKDNPAKVSINKQAMGQNLKRSNKKKS